MNYLKCILIAISMINMVSCRSHRSISQSSSEQRIDNFVAHSTTELLKADSIRYVFLPRESFFSSLELDPRGYIMSDDETLERPAPSVERPVLKEVVVYNVSRLQDRQASVTTSHREAHSGTVQHARMARYSWPLLVLIGGVMVIIIGGSLFLKRFRF